MDPRRALTGSPFDTLEKTFDLLVSGPHPLALDGTGFAGLPERAVPLGELKARLLHPSMPFAARDAVLDELVARAQAQGGPWTVGLAGVLLPGLRRAAWPLAQACPDKAADVEAEMLAGFVAAAARAGRGRARLAAWLTWTAQSRARRSLRAELAEAAHPAGDAVSAAPPRPWGHPDFVLGLAVRAAVVCAEDAELIGATRLSGADLAELAGALGVSYKTMQKRRARAELVLAEWLASDEYPPGRFVEKRAEGPCSSSGGRPRLGRLNGPATSVAKGPTPRS